MAAVQIRAGSYEDGWGNVYGVFRVELTYEREGNDMVYTVTGYSQSYAGWNVSFIGSRSITVTINGETKSGVIPQPGSGGVTSAVIGPWRVRIASETDTALPEQGALEFGGFAGITYFSAPVLAGGALALPVFVTAGGVLRMVSKAFVNAGGAVRECGVYVNTGGIIKKLE